MLCARQEAHQRFFFALLALSQQPLLLFFKLLWRQGPCINLRLGLAQALDVQWIHPRRRATCTGAHENQPGPHCISDAWSTEEKHRPSRIRVLHVVCAGVEPTRRSLLFSPRESLPLSPPCCCVQTWCAKLVIRKQLASRTPQTTGGAANPHALP
jgi:hypothetical protein